MRVKVARNYQITIPAEIRKALGIEEGGLLEIRLEGRMVVERARSARKTLRAWRRLYPEGIEELVTRGLRRSLWARSSIPTSWSTIRSTIPRSTRRREPS